MLVRIDERTPLLSVGTRIPIHEWVEFSSTRVFFLVIVTQHAQDSTMAHGVLLGMVAPPLQKHFGHGLRRGDALSRHIVERSLRRESSTTPTFALVRCRSKVLETDRPKQEKPVEPIPKLRPTPILHGLQSAPRARDAILVPSRHFPLHLLA